MKNEKGNLRVWKTLYFLAHRYIVTKFNMKHDRCVSDKPCIVISNHVTNWDPLLVSMSFPKNNLHFVASEHLFRMGRVSKLIDFLVAPISRRKGSSGLDTAMASLRTIRAGGSVCIFAEGECTWDGANIGIVDSTGTLVRASGARLITYRLEGAYFTMPRWSRGLRRGRMNGHVVNIYEPEQLKAMRPNEITDLINRDIFEDAYARQEKDMVRFRSKKRAEALESALFICPRCKKVGRLHSSGVMLTCECGLREEYTEQGFFAPGEYFRTVMDWDKWQRQALTDGDYVHGDENFADDDVTYAEVMNDHNERIIASGRIALRDGDMHIGGEVLPLSDITDMAIVRTNRLIFTLDGRYYELKAGLDKCMRKYILAWQNTHAE